MAYTRYMDYTLYMVIRYYFISEKRLHRVFLRDYYNTNGLEMVIKKMN